MHRVTTKERDLKIARQVAEDLFLEARFRHKNGIPTQSKRFKDVADLATKRMESALEEGVGKRVYRDYVLAINNYLIPFFGKHHIVDRRGIRTPFSG